MTDETINLYSKCCHAQVYPDGIEQQLVCSDCGEPLGDSPWENENVIVETHEPDNS